MPRPLVRRQPPLSFDEYGFWSPRLLYALAMRGTVRVMLDVTGAAARRRRPPTEAAHRCGSCQRRTTPAFFVPLTKATLPRTEVCSLCGGLTPARSR